MNQTREYMRRFAETLDDALNGKGVRPRKNGFVLLVFPFGGPEDARVNYVSNAERSEMLTALKEIVARFEGRAHEQPKAVQ